MSDSLPAGADRLDARVGGLGVYATVADLVALRRLPVERAVRTALTLLGSWLAVPVAFLIPPHAEPAFVVFLAGLYFARRAWVGEWQVEQLAATCPHCAAPITLRRHTVLYLPHTLACSTCRAELWLELGAAPAVAETVRRAAVEQARAQPHGELGGRPPLTWSPAASNWRDRPRP